ncbi:Mn2+/Fe2+ NRAMP family transporter [Sinomonas atrocyanea]|uniref:Nramp family divalent metal transporter n=1 Tax=Sinomonas atrocyanea TaxID=37927 RepID=UPI00278525D8|nr:Nramp family divalent metal transporter [Sinomonas atrocyanea]MDP9882636.1 Mn2+/Fe2+ NRAMP family transporter [Sinomonas atrocyanea]
MSSKRAGPWWKCAAKTLGPGVVTGASDNDPSGIATYAQAGALYGFGMVWTAPVVLPLMIAAQEMSDRTAAATGKSIGAIVRERFPRAGRITVGILLVLLLVSNTVNLSADLMAVGGGMELLGAGPAQLWSALAGLAIAVLLVAGSYRIVSRIFTGLCLALFTYVAVMFVAHVDWLEVLKGLSFQQLTGDLPYWGLVAGVFGTSISPYLFFWESGQRVEEMRAEKRHGGPSAVPGRDMPLHRAHRRRNERRIDVVTGMTLSVVVMFAVIVATGATLGQHGQSIQTAADAAKALSPIAGPLAGAVFAVGFIGTGLLGVPVLASAACIGLSSLTGKSWGFERSVRRAPVFYGLVLLGTVGGTLLASLFPNPMTMLVLSAMINAVAAAPFLVVVLLIARSRKIMGNARNGVLSNVLGWTTAGAMAVCGVLALWSQLAGSH